MLWVSFSVKTVCTVCSILYACTSHVILCTTIFHRIQTVPTESEKQCGCF